MSVIDAIPNKINLTSGNEEFKEWFNVKADATKARLLKIEFTWKDQGWGNMQSAVRFTDSQTKFGKRVNYQRPAKIASKGSYKTTVYTYLEAGSVLNAVYCAGGQGHTLSLSDTKVTVAS